jgi:hypothetical protein
LDLFGVIFVELAVGSVTNKLDGTIGKTFFHFTTLCRTERGFYTVGMLGTCFKTENACLFAVGD